jgi:choline dehydrogenase-like flavoprotein
MSYDLIVCGTGFASSFFLHKWLQKRPRSRVLVLERGPREDHADLVARQSNTTVDSSTLFDRSGLAGKDWLFTVGLGGSSNCWWAQTPRMWEEDFELKSRYGVGFDWPITYADLAPYYDEAEDLMQVAGPDNAPYPRKGPCPQPAHKLSGFDKAMIAAFPGGWTAAPTARTSLGTSLRAVCCANGVCGICPVDAKFRVMNEMAVLYDDTQNVTLKTEAEVLAIEIEAGQACAGAQPGAGAHRRNALAYMS